jgi:hypothetical protein
MLHVWHLASVAQLAHRNTYEMTNTTSRMPPASSRQARRTQEAHHSTHKRVQASPLQLHSVATRILPHPLHGGLPPSQRGTQQAHNTNTTPNTAPVHVKTHIPPHPLHGSLPPSQRGTQQAHSSAQHTAQHTAAAQRGTQPLTRFMKASRQASVAHSRQSVLPVPVGLSSSAFSDCKAAAAAGARFTRYPYECFLLRTAAPMHVRAAVLLVLLPALLQLQWSPQLMLLAVHMPGTSTSAAVALGRLHMAWVLGPAAP